MTDRLRNAAGSSDAGRRRATRAHRRLLSGAVAILAFRFEVHNTADGNLVDSSWRIGLSWLRAHDLDHGGDVLFTYGPLGLISDPTWASSRTLLALALAASTSVALWFGSVVVRAIFDGERPWWTAGLALGIGALAGVSLGLPELASAVVAIDVYNRLPGREVPPPSRARFLGYGALLAVLALGKTNAGVVAAAAVVVLALAWPGWAARGRRLAAVAGSGAASTVLLWLASGNALGGLPTWLRGTGELVRSYGTSMAATTHDARWVVTELMLLGALVTTGGVVLVVRMRRDGGWSVWPEVTLVSLAAWFSVKAGTVRLDALHIGVALFGLAVWIVVVGAKLQWRALPVLALLLATIGLMADTTTGRPTDLGGVSAQRRRQPAEVWTALSAAVRGAEYDRQVEAERVEVRSLYADMGLDPGLVLALAGDGTYADHSDIAVLWAYGLDWQPLPVLQGYAAYNRWLDDRNADGLRDPAQGPDAVLRSSSSIDDRRRSWDSPTTQLTMACSFAVTAGNEDWEVLQRGPDLCGEPRVIGQTQAQPGEVISVPAGEDGDLVVASFEVHASLASRVLEVLARPLRLPRARVDGSSARFVVDTGPGMHLLRSPDQVGSRDLPGEALAIREVELDHVPGPVDVTFYAVPLR